MHFTCHVCGNHVEVVSPPSPDAWLEDVEAVCHNRHKPVRMEMTTDAHS